MAERLEKHGCVCVVVGDPELEVSAGEVCPRCHMRVKEHRFLWPQPEVDQTLCLFVEACYCGIRFSDSADQPLDETPELWGVPADEVDA